MINTYNESSSRGTIKRSATPVIRPNPSNGTDIKYQSKGEMHAWKVRSRRSKGAIRIKSVISIESKSNREGKGEILSVVVISAKWSTIHQHQRRVLALLGRFDWIDSQCIKLRDLLSATVTSQSFKNLNMSNPPFEPFWVQSDDWHTAGEPFRIIDLSLLPSEYSTTGKTVKERRQNIINTPDHPLDTLRRALCHEPRGHADMYGGYIVPGDDEGAHFGVLFWHKDGFSTACGVFIIRLSAVQV